MLHYAKCKKGYCPMLDGEILRTHRSKKALRGWQAREPSTMPSKVVKFLILSCYILVFIRASPLVFRVN